MKNNRSTVILALSTILIGALLIAFPANATRWLIMAIGALFLVPGVVGVLTYLVQRNKKADTLAQTNGHNAAAADKDAKKDVLHFPFIGIGSILFGAVLLIIPGSFLNALLYILGAFLLLAGLAQIYRFLQIRNQYKLSATPYVVSALISVAGIAIIVLNYKSNNVPVGAQPGDSPHYWPSIIFGVASVIFGLTEIIYAIQFRKSGKKEGLGNEAEANIDEVEVVEEKPKAVAEEKPKAVAEEKPQIVEAGPAKPAPAPSFSVPEYTSTAPGTSYTTALPQTPNTTIEAEVDSEA